MVALLTGAGCFSLVIAFWRRPMFGRLEEYVAPSPDRGQFVLPKLSPASVIGAAVGGLAMSKAAVPGMMIGAVAGAVFARIRDAARARRARTRLGQELPAIADLLSLHVLSGDSVIGSMKRVCAEASGVAVREIDGILQDVGGGLGLPEAVQAAVRGSAHPDAGRLYEMLGQAHRTGSRLIDALTMFATDRRAAIARELAAEGGRRALTGYGPIIGLMIPTTLVFLMYPTLAGLRALSATP